MLKRSFASFILLVACGSIANFASTGSIPLPLSLTTISFRPPSVREILILFAPASIEFSTNSLTTEETFSITSPAAIKLVTCWSNLLIMPIIITYFNIFFNSSNKFIASNGLISYIETFLILSKTIFSCSVFESYNIGG